MKLYNEVEAILHSVHRSPLIEVTMSSKITLRQNSK